MLNQDRKQVNAVKVPSSNTKSSHLQKPKRI